MRNVERFLGKLVKSKDWYYYHILPFNGIHNLCIEFYNLNNQNKRVCVHGGGKSPGKIIKLDNSTGKEIIKFLFSPNFMKNIKDMGITF